MAKIGNGDWIPKERWREGDGDQGKGVKFGLFTVFVDNLPSAMVAKTLFKLFSQFGIVKEVFIPLKRRTVSKSRFGFVRFNCPVAADIAIQKGNGLLVEERVLEVKKATKDRSIRFEQMFVNGKFCKDPKLATADDFFFHGLRGLRNTSNSVGSTVTPVDVMQIPGLNTLGISLVRIDYAPNGLIPPHMHPRASEILVVLEGTLYVGFVTSNTDNRLFTKVLYRGDVFVFPEGLIHFQFNLGKSNAVALAGLSSQNPGIITVANAVFGSNPKISADVLAKAFQVDKKIVDYLEAKFW